jgi:hypothetical protein
MWLRVGAIIYKNINIDIIFIKLFLFKKKILKINIDINAVQIGKITKLYLCEKFWPGIKGFSDIKKKV